VSNIEYKNEIQVQDNVSEDYEHIRYVNAYSVMYQNSWFKTMTLLIDQKGLILDNGCGIGNLVELLPKNDIIGLDISKGMLTKAKERMNTLVNGDSQRLPFKDETFDVIVCRSLLHHLPNPKEGVSEMYRALKKSGEVIISEPIQSILSKIPRKLVKGSKHFSEIHKDFKKIELISIISDKFRIEEIRHVGYIAYPLLGFPDVVDLFRYFPFKKQVASFLIDFDRLLSTIPLINTQSWGIIIKASKREEKS
jgi:ubiquinone/menaquinone biosynthesis C-methylase UbiE